MQGTCDPKKCAFLRKVLKEKDPAGCPNYIESFWLKTGESQPTLVRDCAPRRTLLICQELINSNIGLQQANEKMRNKAGRVLDVLEEAMQSASLQNGPLPAKQIEGGGIPS